MLHLWEVNEAIEVSCSCEWPQGALAEQGVYGYNRESVSHLPDRTVSRLSDAEIRRVAREASLDDLLAAATRLRDVGHGEIISYSRKVFIPLTKLCRDVCHYCTFAQPPSKDAPAYLSPEEVLAIARAGEKAGCHEALFTLGDRPELRYPVAREELARRGHATTLSYLKEMCALVLRETSLLPHINPGVMTREEIASLRRVSVSQGIMLESVSPRLCEEGGPHYGSPDKVPTVRLAMIRAAGELKVPFTTGILIGIGETRDERVDSLLAIREIHEEHGHIQEVIVQNFRAKPLTRMAGAAEPDLEDLMWTLAVARLVFGPTMNLQAPPNLTPSSYSRLVAAGLNDWGGVSPVTPDHVNPEAPWPHLARLREQTERAGKLLVERLAVYPSYGKEAAAWQDPSLVPRVVRAMDTEGYARTDTWSPGQLQELPPVTRVGGIRTNSEVERILADAFDGATLAEAGIVRLFGARGRQFEAVCSAADELRRRTAGDVVRYVVNRNINYTNVCSYRCQFCAFSKGKLSENLRGLPYDVEIEEVVRRTEEAWERGATEVCMQGGIKPDYTGETYLSLCRAVKSAVPRMHIHAFSPLEVTHGAQSLNLSVEEFLPRLRAAGLGTLPGTAAEILDDEVRRVICPDKLTTDEWLHVMEAAHLTGFRTTATIMFGHVDRYEHWARHLLRVRALQMRTGGFTEFVPLPFVHMETPIYLKGLSRKGPTYRESVLMHAVARLALHPVIPNIQVSWVKLGPEAARVCLNAGANDMGGTLMNESISRAAGTLHGQEMSPERMDALIESCGRVPEQRTTLYVAPPADRLERSYAAKPLAPIGAAAPAPAFPLSVVAS
jgi:FO synthase